MPNRKPRGFTLLELMLVVALIGILAALAIWGFMAQRQREQLQGAALELKGVLLGARQTALTTGNRVAVMIFPNVATSRAGARGRVVVYEDGDFDLFSGGGPVSFAAYDPDTTDAGPRSQVVDTMDMPGTVVIGPPDGWGAGARSVAPYADVPLDTPCAFCTGVDSRGAIVFEPLGTVVFYAENGAPLAMDAAAVSLTAPDTQEVNTILVAGNGSMRALFTTR